ncbi:DUF1934 domain-containing protein [Sporomusa sp.]|jgi:uncharacterized beta-barrel protein YwiB (DUF1934 family)|uniref:DUF1934 domain-containing protein n=1 Tax=Sporomusa sp. TaxID=2078658 RepID=UPI002BC4E295|nr:DUF1934 domain-containing protein [Sporomusa sp.]HWR09172.1 DUF1934 domain-containing protein [Sporomusa sp.]
MSLIEALNGNTGIDHVLITVTGCQRDAHGDENTIELFTHGRSHVKNGVHYISYQETEVSGLEGATTLLKIYPDYVILVRRGRVEQRQEFRIGKCCSSCYVTPYGTIKMGVRTTQLTITRTPETSWVSGVNIEYELEIDGQWQSANKLAVIVQGDKKNGH